MDVNNQIQYNKVRKRISQKKRFYIHAIFFVIGAIILYGITLISGFSLAYSPTLVYILIAIWFVFLVLHFIKVFITSRFFDEEWERIETEKLLKKHDKKVQLLEKKLQKEGVLGTPKTSEKKKKGFFAAFTKEQNVTIIAALGTNNELGKDNDLIWRLPEDLKRFKKLTSGHHIIMGRKTFESIGKPLPNRTSVIITRDENYTVDNCLTANSLEEALDLAKKDESPFIIGGAQIYNQALKVATNLEITYVHHEFEADVFFPKIDLTLWEETSRELHKTDDKHLYDYSFVSYKRK
jgi:dihydrofolate reductase